MALYIPPNRLRPRFRNWLRLEGNNRLEDFRASYSLPTADPLWMLGRQWQMGEFEAEDNGTPLYATVELKTAPITKLRFDGEEMELSPTSCLEAEVERMAMPLNWRDRIRIGKHFARLMGSEFSVSDFDTRYQTQNPGQESLLLEGPKPDDPAVDKETKAYVKLILSGTNSLLDGSKLVTAIRNENRLPNVGDGVLTQFQEWYASIYGSWEEDSSKAWKGEQLRYEFALSTLDDTTDQEELVLKAPDYQSGSLDWYSFDEAEIPEASHSEEVEIAQAQRNAIRYEVENISLNALPKKRLYEFEDSRINLTQSAAGRTDLLYLFLAEFAMVYSADWFSFKLPLSPSSIAQIDSITVVDGFGISTKITQSSKVWKPFEEQDPKEAWDAFKIRKKTPGKEFDELFGNKKVHNFLFLPPISGKAQVSEAIEKVVFQRNQVDNTVKAPNENGEKWLRQSRLR